jgi:HlyD family secretion protein
VVIGLALYVVLNRGEAGNDVVTASGTVEATEATLGFQIAGRIEVISPREGDRVSAGQEVAALESTELEARRAQAGAQLAAARALLDEMQTGARAEELAQATQAARAAGERLADARRDLERVQRLVEGGALSQEALDKARLALEVAESQGVQAQQQLRLVETGPRPERITAQRAAVGQAEAAVRQADAALANTVIRAPFDGIVTVRGREPGETVAPGSPVVTVMNLHDRWVRIYIREDRIGAVRVGQAATITADTYRDRQYPGEVSFIASQAEFTPRNVQTTEERVKLVYAVKVRVAGDSALDLKPGMPADVRIEPGVQ